MKFKILEDDFGIYLESSENPDDSFSEEIFYKLTGKRIDFTKRINKHIFTERYAGHIYIRDEIPIIDEIYIINNKYFKCVSVNNKEGLLSSVDNSLTILNMQGPLLIK